MIPLREFVAESNRIENLDSVSPDDMKAHEEILALRELSVQDIERFVSLVQPNAILRRPVGLNVKIGSHFPPPGGPKIEPALKKLLGLVNRDWVEEEGHCDLAAYKAHLAYENLHPFSDGNGRSGRAIWLWMHKGYTGRGFLYEWNKARLEYAGLDFFQMRAMYYHSMSDHHG